jgi:hypothetical protein
MTFPGNAEKIAGPQNGGERLSQEQSPEISNEEGGDRPIRFEDVWDRIKEKSGDDGLMQVYGTTDYDEHLAKAQRDKDKQAREAQERTKIRIAEAQQRAPKRVDRNPSQNVMNIPAEEIEAYRRKVNDSETQKVEAQDKKKKQKPWWRPW